MRNTIRGTAYGHARREQARTRGNRHGRRRVCESGSGECHRVCLCLPGSVRLRRDVYATELCASIRRECLSSLVDEERASAIGRDDAKSTDAVSDEPDETARGEHAGRRGYHVRLEIL
jgi:hypothetical protein